MIVFSLSCTEKHAFDGWFRSSDDFDSQRRMGLVECPVCGDADIAKQLSAPRINSGASAHRAETPASAQPVPAATMVPGLQQHMLREFKQFVVANTENVGSAFAETARRMHYGEESHRSIRGRVSADEARVLHDEGIDTMALPPGVMMDEGLQ